MDIERIDDNIIRIVITQQDLDDRNLDLDELNYESPETQELFWDMMEQAEDEFGFFVVDSQLIVEPIPSSDNGFIVTITKIDNDADNESIQKYIRSRGRKNNLKKNELTKKQSNIHIYAFESFDDLVSIAKRISTIFAGDSSVYKYWDEYYLKISNTNIDPFELAKLDLLFGEYGDKIQNPNYFEGILCEHGEVFIENFGLEVLNTYFD
jgi:adapter protein MecA 1/2